MVISGKTKQDYLDNNFNSNSDSIATDINQLASISNYISLDSLTAGQNLKIKLIPQAQSAITSSNTLFVDATTSELTFRDNFGNFKIIDFQPLHSIQLLDNLDNPITVKVDSIGSPSDAKYTLTLQKGSSDPIVKLATTDDVSASNQALQDHIQTGQHDTQLSVKTRTATTSITKDPINDRLLSGSSDGELYYVKKGSAVAEKITATGNIVGYALEGATDPSSPPAAGKLPLFYNTTTNQYKLYVKGTTNAWKTIQFS